MLIIILPLFYTQRTVLDSSSPVYELWKDAPVDIYNKFYFFNITNPIEIERNGAGKNLFKILNVFFSIKINSNNMFNLYNSYSNLQLLHLRKLVHSHIRLRSKK